MERISRYRLTIPSACGRGAFVETILCPACAGREIYARTLVRPEPSRLCARCGLDGLTVRPVFIAAVRVGLERAVVTARAQLSGQPLWLGPLEDAATWLRSQVSIFTDGHIVLIPSDADPAIVYSVNGTCQCRAYDHRANPRHDRACKHRVRAKLLKRAIDAQADAESLAYRVVRVAADPAPDESAISLSGRSAQDEADELFPD